MPTRSRSRTSPFTPPRTRTSSLCWQRTSSPAKRSAATGSGLGSTEVTPVFEVEAAQVPAVEEVPAAALAERGGDVVADLDAPPAVPVLPLPDHPAQQSGPVLQLDEGVCVLGDGRAGQRRRASTAPTRAHGPDRWSSPPVNRLRPILAASRTLRLSAIDIQERDAHRGRHRRDRGTAARPGIGPAHDQ
jgi:hypothetical protein